MSDTRWKSVGNARTWDESDRIDVIPLGDVVDHDTVTDDCVCIPRMELIKRANGADGWLVVHSSLDGREASDA